MWNLEGVVCHISHCLTDEAPDGISRVSFRVRLAWVQCSGEIPHCSAPWHWSVPCHPPRFQGQHYKRVPQAGGQLQVVHCQQAPLVRFHQVRTDPLLREDFDLPHFHLREFTAVGGIHQNRPFLSCLFRAVVQQGMAAVGQSDTESLLFRLDMLIPLYSVTSNNPICDPCFSAYLLIPLIRPPL